MTRIADHRAILGLDPSSRGLAFVFFENGALLDWGTRRDDGNELAVFDRLLDFCKADVVILEDPDALRCERRARMRRLLRLMARHARERGVSVLAISRHEVRKQWLSRGTTRKYGVAAAIGAMFPEIEPLVPRRRKSYRSEEARAEIFDAVSLVLQACSLEPEAREDEATDRSPRAST
ncbi:MAG TPA: hypothetical protein VN181_11430 [Thermoanaerobaculia bacterium]|nr:hypothetical protein [Thermoanaerobaculia bacterium]